MATDYKQKYIDIRAKLLESTDTAYRLGYEEGMKEGQRAAEQQAKEAEAAAQAAAMGGMPPGAEGGMPPGAEGGAPPELAPEDMAAGGAPAPEDMGEEEASDIDSQIAELESLVQKGEKPSVVAVRKAVEKLSDVRKSHKAKQDQKTNSPIASSQKNFVDGILKKWEEDAQDVTEGLEDIIKEHGIEIKD